MWTSHQPILSSSGTSGLFAVYALSAVPPYPLMPSCRIQASARTRRTMAVKMSNCQPAPTHTHTHAHTHNHAPSNNSSATFPTYHPFDYTFRAIRS